MKNCFFSKEKRNIKKLINDLSKVLNVDVDSLSFLEDKLDKIILNNSLNEMLETYFSLLESEMADLITERITPSFQFGIKNKYFSFIGYAGKFAASPNSRDVDENTYYSFDSISKVLTSVITMMMIRDGNVTIDSTVNSFNPEFNLDASIGSILNFSAWIMTEKRVDNLSREETIEILKKCREDVVEKSKYKNYYQYSDMGYMILRLGIPDFLERLDTILAIIDKDNLTYKNIENKDLITGGKIGLEHYTPDTKGRGILFPGHTGLYGNISGLLNLFNEIFYTENILTKEELTTLLKEPYSSPEVYTKEGNRALSKNGSSLYMAKVAGIYRTPSNIPANKINKMVSCDFSNLTTNRAKASAGTCGSWVMGDNLSYQGMFGSYVGGILSNPYTYVNPLKYPDINNPIPNTNLTVNQNGVILGYSGKLNPYKEVIARYGILLELLTEYLKNTDLGTNLEQNQVTYIRKLKRPQ